MNSSLLTPLAILLGAALIAGAIYLRPEPVATRIQAIYGPGYIYFVDLQKLNSVNRVPILDPATPVHP
jgi:hypothetical protein